jgi:hypothetical protein
MRSGRQVEGAHQRPHAGGAHQEAEGMGTAMENVAGKNGQ